MAIYHLSVKAISRSTGRSAPGAAAYRAGEKIVHERTGEVFDYSRKLGVGLTGIVMPSNAAWTPTRSELWNAAEAAEKRKDACVAREHEIALPKELTDQERFALVKGYAQDLADRHGCAVDYAIHHPHRGRDGESNENWHAHLLTTTREVAGDGLGQKCQREKAGQNRAADLELERKIWAEQCNTALEQAGHAERVDHRSLEAQGIDRDPTSHKGVAVTGMERRGIETDVGARLAAAQAEGELDRRLAADLDRRIIDTKTSLNQALAEREAHRKEIRHARDQHPSRTQEPATLATLRDVWGVDNVHDLGRSEDLLQSHAPDHLRRSEQAQPGHLDLHKLDAERDRRVAPPTTEPPREINRSSTVHQPSVNTPAQQAPAKPVEQAAPAKAMDAKKPEPQPDVSHRAHLTESDRELIVNTEKSLAAAEKGREGAIEALGTRLYKLEATAAEVGEQTKPYQLYQGEFNDKHHREIAARQSHTYALMDVNEQAKKEGYSAIPYPEQAGEPRSKGFEAITEQARAMYAEHMKTQRPAKTLFGNDEKGKAWDARAVALKDKVAGCEKALAWRDKARAEAIEKRQPKVEAQVEKKRQEHAADKAKDLSRVAGNRARHQALGKEIDRLKDWAKRVLTPERQKQLQRTVEHVREMSNQRGIGR